jgi:anhydro-N-acetylmuramic acid kinase
VLALGLMSGTSLDGIDAALIETDGETVSATGGFRSETYDQGFRERLRQILGRESADPEVDAVERELTLKHATAVKELLQQQGLTAAQVHCIGFHGHTILHRPETGRTWQIGDSALLARETGIDVVGDLRQADVAAGGQGAPLAPAYHGALAVPLEKPLAVVNIGGVANVTWIGRDGALLAFDTGPGNALIDDWVRRHTGAAADFDGRLAKNGSVDETVLAALLKHDYFNRPPPKSLDRDDFDAAPVAALSPADGAATLTAFTAAAVAQAKAVFPEPVVRWLICGGGRHNPALMAALAGRLGAPVAPIEQAGRDGDALEAQAFGYLAVRSLRGLPLSWPTTTGVPAPAPGGQLYPSHPVA